jgi:hypothetical protein
MTTLRFRDEFRQFLCFVRRPSLKREVKHTIPVSGGVADWWPSCKLSRLLAWAGALWLINIVALGPIVLTVFEMSGATHRISVHNLPWFQALLWAPIIEEMLFRFGLRRPFLALLVVPVLIYVFLNGFAWWASSLIVLMLLMLIWSMRHANMPSGNAWRWLRTYRWAFPVVMHASVLAFAALHIHNYEFEDLAWWMMAVLVLPQWVTGLALCWIRVQRGIGAAVLVHALFNAGPLCLAWLALQAVGDAI